MVDQTPQAPIPNWLASLIGIGVAVGISWGINTGRLDAMSDRLARVELEQQRVAREMDRVTRFEERLSAMAITLTEIRNELREHSIYAVRPSKHDEPSSGK